MFPCKESLTLEQYAEQYCHLVNENCIRESRNKTSAASSEVTDDCVKGFGEMQQHDQEQHASSCGKSEEASSDSAKSENNVHVHLDASKVPPETDGSLRTETVELRKRATVDSEESGELTRKKLRTDEKCMKQGLERVVFVDSTWTQVRKIVADDRLKRE